MKSPILFLPLLFVSYFSFSQQTIDGSLMHDGIERNYIMYIPASYSGNEPVPLVFNFHGYTSNATQQMWYGNFQPAAERAGFIVVHPEGTLLNGETHFNVGGFTQGSTVDDVGFTEAMINKFVAEMNIDETRIYSTGMSNGGYMSYLLACQLSDKIAAVASVTGSMTLETFNNCDARHPTPILQIHGTLDPTVPYSGDVWTKPVEEVVEYWATFNNCDPNPLKTDIPDRNATDGCTAEHFVYENGDAGVNTEFIKITGGQHTWPGAFLNFPGTSLDFNASDEIWRFFDRYDINGLRNISASEDLVENVTYEVFPNPVVSKIRVKCNLLKAHNFQLMNFAGESVLRGLINQGVFEIDMENLPEGIYFLKIGESVRKILKIK